MNQEEVEALRKSAEKAMKEDDRKELHSIKKKIEIYKKDLTNINDVNDNYGKIAEVDEEITKYLDIDNFDSLYKFRVYKFFSKLTKYKFIVAFLIVGSLLLFILGPWNSINKLWDRYFTDEPKKEIPVKEEPQEDEKDIAPEEEDKPKPIKVPTVSFNGDNIPEGLQREISNRLGWRNVKGKSDFTMNFDFDHTKLVQTKNPKLFHFEGSKILFTINDRSCETDIELAPFKSNDSITGAWEEQLINKLNKEIKEQLSNPENYERISQSIKSCI